MLESPFYSPEEKKMKSVLLVTVALSLSMFVGCGSTQDDESWDLETCDQNCEEKDAPALSAIYVSGHLGNYQDCPGDGYSPEPVDGDFAAGDCAEGQDCNFVLNCEDAQMTVQLENTGNASASGVQVSKIELFDSEGVSLAELPLMQTVDTTTNQPFAASLAIDEQATLRVEFQGPQNPYELANDAGRSASGDSAMAEPWTIEITFSADNHDDFTVESTAVYPVPSVDT